MDSISARCWSLSQGGSTALYGHSAKYRVSGYFQRKWKSISVTFSIVFINHETLDLLRVRPEIALDASGKPLISPEILGAFDPTPDRRALRPRRFGPSRMSATRFTTRSK